jgi:long-chain acyl-CoA synthetase
VLTHANLLAMTLNYLTDVDHAAVGDHLLHAAPMSHGSGLYTVPNIAVGATQLIPATRGFDVDEIRHILAWTPSVKFFAAPTMVMRLVDAYGTALAARQPEDRDLWGRADVRRRQPARARLLRQAAGADLRPGRSADDDHGASEGRPLRRSRRAPAGAPRFGRPRADRRRNGVLDATTSRCQPGEIGEVCVRGDVVMAGYLNSPEATAAALSNGWLHTGDLGRLDEHGYLTLVDRSKDLIISGGSNIYPREVEEVLLLHPAIKEAAVIGVPDEEWGESVLAAVVKKEGHIPDERELDLFCLEHIARFKRPKRYVFVDELPKNATGKVLKRELRERFRTP